MAIDLMHSKFENVSHKIPDGSIDLVLTDPPFGTTANKWDIAIDPAWLWPELDRLCKSGAARVLKAVDPYSSILVSTNQAQYKHKWYWKKNRAGNFAVTKHQPLSVIEELLVFGIGKTNYYPQKVKGEMRTIGSRTSNTNGQGFGGIDNISYQSDMRHPQNLMEIKTVERKDSIHPSQTPVRLWEYLIKTYSKEGDTILDFAMGSGSCGQACKNLERNYVGIEMDRDYFSAASSRLNPVGLLI